MGGQFEYEYSVLSYNTTAQDSLESRSQSYIATHNLEPTTAILYSRMSKPLAAKAHLNFALRFLRQGLSSSHIEHDATRYNRDRRGTCTSMKDLTSDPVQVDYSILLHCHTGCLGLYGILYEGGRAGGVEVVVVGTTNKQVLRSIFLNYIAS